jgi:ribosomal protein S8
MALLDDLKSTPMFANCADEKAVVDKAKNLSENATKLEALENANKSLKAKLEASESKEIETFLNAAIKEGRIKEEQKETFKALMKSDRKNTEALINSIKPQKAGLVTEFINQGSQAQFENKDWDTLDKEGKLSELKATNLAKFKELFKDKYGVEYTEE